MKNLLSKSLCLVLVIAFLFPFNSFATEISTNEAENDTETILKYVTADESGVMHFDEESAVSNGEDDFIIEAGEQLELMSKQYTASEKGIMLRNGLPIYGNWCGPGHGGGNPIDYLDKQCKKHDECYGSEGYFSCGCDETLISAIDEKYSSMTGKMKTAAAAVRAYFIMQRTWCIIYAY